MKNAIISYTNWIKTEDWKVYWVLKELINHVHVYDEEVNWLLVFNKDNVSECYADWEDIIKSDLDICMDELKANLWELHIIKNTAVLGVDDEVREILSKYIKD